MVEEWFLDSRDDQHDTHGKDLLKFAVFMLFFSCGLGLKVL